MKIVLLYIAILFTSLTYSQNTEIDKRNGFKSLKIGTNIEKLENLEILNKTKFKTSTLWKPSKDSELNYLFDNKIDVFALIFDNKNKLIEIKLSLFKNVKPSETVMANKFTSIEKKLSSVLGNPTSMPQKLLDSLDDDILVNLLWKGEKVSMFLYLEINDKHLNKNNEFVSLQSINLLVRKRTSNKNFSNGF